jgi:sulfate permease, SulP family
MLVAQRRDCFHQATPIADQSHAEIFEIFGDFSKVVGIDTSAASTMVGISRTLQDKKIKQAIVGLSPAAERVIRAAGGLDKTVLQFADIDEALEEGEKLILSGMSESLFPKQTFEGWISHVVGSNEDSEALQRHLVRSQVSAGSFLCHQGETTDDLYFVDTGRLSAVIERESSNPIRVFGEKTIIGEIAFVLNVPRTASLRVDEDAIVWVLSRSEFDKLLKTHPTLVLKLLQHMVRLQVERLSFATRRIAALQISPASTNG